MLTVGKRRGAVRTGFTQKGMCAPVYDLKRFMLDHGREKKYLGWKKQLFGGVDAG